MRGLRVLLGFLVVTLLVMLGRGAMRLSCIVVMLRGVMVCVLWHFVLLVLGPGDSLRCQRPTRENVHLVRL